MNSVSSAPLAHTITEAAQRIGIGRTLMYELLKTGEIRGIQIGQRRLIPASELERFVVARMRPQA